MSKTPETDAAKINKRDTYLLSETIEWIVTAEFAEKLECQRNEVMRLTEHEWLLKVACRLVSAGCKSDGILESLDEVIRERDEARIELERVRKELVDANRGAEKNAHINNSLCSKLIKAERERDEVIKQKVLGFNALRSAWSVINHALKEER